MENFRTFVLLNSTHYIFSWISSNHANLRLQPEDTVNVLIFEKNFLKLLHSFELNYNFQIRLKFLADILHWKIEDWFKLNFSKFLT